jgi:hypothetical protein
MLEPGASLFAKHSAGLLAIFPEPKKALAIL